MKRSEIRQRPLRGKTAPDDVSLHPGYGAGPNRPSRRPGQAKREPGSITTNARFAKAVAPPYASGEHRWLWVPAFAGTTEILIPIMRRLNKTAVVGRADQDLVHADPRRHAGDEGDGAAAIL